MKSILIGATGFVGGVLQRYIDFDALASSKNISDFAGEQFDFAIVAAGDARKWYANQNPERDAGHIDRLIEDIKPIQVRHLLQFSTVDVYATSGDESSLTGAEAKHAYGANRLRLENGLRDLYENTQIVRLPGLFGPGLKKNLIFDTIQDRELSGFHPDSTFQWFDMTEIGRVVNLVRESGLNTLNLAIEPTTVREVLEALGHPTSGLSIAANRVEYDVRTANASLFGHRGPYCYEKTETLERIARFFASEKVRQG